MANSIGEMTVKVNVKVSWGNLLKMYFLKRIFPIYRYTISDLIEMDKK